MSGYGLDMCRGKITDYTKKRVDYGDKKKEEKRKTTREDHGYSGGLV